MPKRIFIRLSEATADVLRFAAFKTYKICGFIQQKIAGNLIELAVRIEAIYGCRSMLVDKYRCERYRNHGSSHMAHTDKGVEWWDDPI